MDIQKLEELDSLVEDIDTLKSELVKKVERYNMLRMELNEVLSMMDARVM